jgi:glycine/serine hydroxymethyltransferase
MKEAEMKQIAALIAEVLSAPEDEAVRGGVSEKVKELTVRFPLYAHRLKPGEFGASGD